MSLSISTFFLASALPIKNGVFSAYFLALRIPHQDFELDYLFQDNHIVVSSFLPYYKVQIQVLTLIDFGASSYAFMDQDFAHQHFFLLYKLKHPGQLCVCHRRPD